MYSVLKKLVQNLVSIVSITSIDPDVRKFFNLTMDRNAKIDDVVLSAEKNLPTNKFKKVCDTALKKTERDTTWEKFMGLNKQCKIISFIVDEAFVSDIINWKKVTNKLPANIFRFCRRYLVLSLANNSNLHRWKISNNGLYSLCNILQTQFHVFNNCKQALDRYTWKHDSILFTITEHLKPKLANRFCIYVDFLHLEFPSPKGLLSAKIPDIVLQQGEKLIVIELTYPAETNLLSSCEYKSNHYKELKNLSLVSCNDLEFVLLEISTLGFVTKHVREFKNLLNLLKCDTKRIMMSCSEVAIRCSYYIYCRGNKEWLTPEILKFV